jgi:hypothetical protein
VDTSTHLTLGIAATRIGGGCQVHHLQRLARRGRIPHTKVGRLHLVAVADLSAIRRACIEAGYVQADVKPPAEVAPC